MEEQPLNKSIPLSALYKSLVKHYAKQNKYIDKLEEEVASLKEQLRHRKNEVVQLRKAAEKTSIKRKRNINCFQKFCINHREENVNTESIRELINEIKNIVNEQMP